MSRPSVSVVVPFAGTSKEGRDLLAALGQLALRSEDEVVVVDNTAAGVIVSSDLPDTIKLVRATREHTSYHARNAGALASSRPWLLFVDSDCRPQPDLIDRYFEPEPAPRCGALAGEITGDPAQRSVAARWAYARGRLGQRLSFQHPYRPYGSTANLLVRREAFDELEGFTEGVRSGGDVDFCWRLAGAGWSLDLRADAVVMHRHRETIGALLRQAKAYGGSRAWLERRHEGSRRARSDLRFVLVSLAKAFLCLTRMRLEQAQFHAIDAAATAAEMIGARGGNGPGGRPGPSG